MNKKQIIHHLRLYKINEIFPHGTRNKKNKKWLQNVTKSNLHAMLSIQTLNDCKFIDKYICHKIFLYL